MDELLHHCLRELSFDGDLGELSHHMTSNSEDSRVRTPLFASTWSLYELELNFTSFRLQPFPLEGFHRRFLLPQLFVCRTEYRRFILCFRMVPRRAAAQCPCRY